jgi:hypothetical protein
VKNAFISGDSSEILRKKRAAKSGDMSAAGEIEAAKALKNAGTNVHFRKAAGDAGIANTRTSDFFVGGYHWNFGRINMSDITCKCGHSFSDGQIPSPYKQFLISDRQVDGLVEQLLSLMKNASDNLGDIIYYTICNTGATVYTCPRCGRLIVFNEKAAEKADVEYVLVN